MAEPPLERCVAVALIRGAEEFERAVASCKRASEGLALCTRKGKAGSRMIPRRLRGIAKQPNKATQWLNRALATCMPKVAECHETTARQSAGTRKGFFVGLCFLLPSLILLLRGRRLQDWRQIIGTLLGLDFLANSGLSLYAFSQDIRFCSYPIAFHVTRHLLVVTAIMMLIAFLYASANRKKIAP